MYQLENGIILVIYMTNLLAFLKASLQAHFSLFK